VAVWCLGFGPAASEVFTSDGIGRLRHFWLELRPPSQQLTGKPHFCFAADCFGQMSPKRCHDRFGAMRIAPAVGPFSIKIVRMVGDYLG
jgi:hypothetical protein